jgi:putative copper export protein
MTQPLDYEPHPPRPPYTERWRRAFVAASAGCAIAGGGVLAGALWEYGWRSGAFEASISQAFGGTWAAALAALGLFLALRLRRRGSARAGLRLAAVNGVLLLAAIFITLF